MAIRVGIDVGGTFTDAVAIDDDTYELIGGVKVLTTHTADEGVALGIIKALHSLMEKYKIKGDDIIFIAHGTTQATNALLEGDVSQVGVITLGQGLEGLKAKIDTNIGTIVLSQGKSLVTHNEFVNLSNIEDFKEAVSEAIISLKNRGAISMVATEAFSVDNPENEIRTVDLCSDMGIPATPGNEVSKLYGLKVRTRTAVVNASIMPRMLETANMTEESIKKAEINAPLMVMRCDGGVMSVDEVRKRPILTILSGPAAGVAGALMYEKVTDGIFLEVGGTSSDISCVRDGSVMVNYAEVGGHKTYLNSLDVRTVGIGGGSMIEMENGRAVNVGPRSAHILNMLYEVYSDEKDIVEPVLKTTSQRSGSSNYAYVECSNGKKFALTLSGAANIAGFVSENDYARGNIGAALKAWKPLAESMHLSIEEAANKVLDFSAKKNGHIVKNLINDYKLSLESVTLVGGGGGASTVVPHLAEKLGCHYKIAQNSSIISPIGVSLALVRESVERTIPDASDKDVLAVRNEAFNMAVKSGALPDMVEVKVTVDPRNNKVCAVATGATELRTKDLNRVEKNSDELKEIVAENLRVDIDNIKLEADNVGYCVFSTYKTKKFLKIFKKKIKYIRLIDRSGVVRLQRINAYIHTCLGKNALNMVRHILEKYTICGEGGEEIPNIYIVGHRRIIKFVGIQKKDQVLSLSQVELKGINDEEKVIMICTLTTENDRG